MKLTNCAFSAALVLAVGCVSATAGEQQAGARSVLQPTVMSDAQLNQIVGAGANTFLKVSINRTKAFENSGGKSQGFQNKSQGKGNGAGGALSVINNNPSP